MPGKEMNRLRRISVDDDYSFEYNHEVLNACFGENRTYWIQDAVWNSKDGCKVWFPHMAKMKNGQYVAGSKEVNWKNYFDDDGNIIQMLYPGEMANNKGKQPEFSFDPTPTHTFMKMEEKSFKYVGTFVQDYKSSSLRYHIARRVKDSIDLSIWASGHDTTYFDVSEIGRDVFKELYIEKSFSKHKQLIEKFLGDDAKLSSEEASFCQIKSAFIDRFSMPILSKMDDNRFVDDVIPELATTLNSLFDSHYSSEGIKEIIGGLFEFGDTLRDLLYDVEVSVNDKIRNCKWGSVLGAQLLTLYEEDSEELLYTLPEQDIDRMLYSLGIIANDKDDLIEKQSMLYFWRNCDDVLLGWTTFRYYQFLRYMSEIKKKSIQYIPAAKPDVKNRILSEGKRLDEEIEEETLEEAPNEFQYNSMPRSREIEISGKVSKGNLIPRHADRKINALVRAGYCCEIDRSHPTFKRRNSDKNYTETHHLIPLEYSAQFQYTLDTEENIVSLCSNCHNQIHYGAGAEVLIKQLFEKRKEALKNAGIGVTESGIEVDLTQLLHMYGLD